MAKKNKKKNDTRISNIPLKVKDRKEGVISYKKDMTVLEFSKELGVPVTEIITKLIGHNIFANQNQAIEKDLIELIALDYNYEIEDEVVTDVDRFDEFEIKDDEKSLIKRPPVVTIMGHVDHGKTTLLDTIRSSMVVNQEAGGITQHIGAYQVERHGELITFIDTPGHEAFTEMRARGASITDITILVVAADDGVMPQTEEAIAHAKEAKTPIIVAVNKMDKPQANPDKVMQELMNYELVPEAWGGDTVFCEISALQGQGIENLLEMILLISEVEEYKANPNRLAYGTVLEAHLDKGKGPVATLLVQNGTLHVGDIAVCGDTYGKVRSMHDEGNNYVDICLPSGAMEITGLNNVPKAGDKFMVMREERKARQVAESRTHKTKLKEKTIQKAQSLDELFGQIKDENLKELKVIIKGDTQGSIEALKTSLLKIDVDGAHVSIIRTSVGSITETDVTLAQASNAIVIGFNVRPSMTVRNVASHKGVEIRLYSIIYKVIEDIESAMHGMLDPEFEEIVTGQAEVRQTYKVSSVGTIAGCYVTEGFIKRNSMVRIIRDGIVVYDGNMASLKRFKDDVKEVKSGYECGITIEKFNDIKEGDIFETSIMKEIERKK